jgi:hypothetical protein
MVPGHVALESAGADADEGHAAAVLGAMFAWILKMKPLKAGCPGAISVPAMTRGLGGGETGPPATWFIILPFLKRGENSPKHSRIAPPEPG